MRKLALAIAISALALSPALAQETCQSKAIGKDGKPLAGAALKSFMTKCEKDAGKSCGIAATEKKLKGAAKTSFTKKCITDSIGA